MKQTATMTERCAVDTNVLVHLYDNGPTPKRQVAELLVESTLVVGQQVVSEYLNVTRRLLALPKDEVLSRCNKVFVVCELVNTTHATLRLAAHLLARYDFQLFDAIIAASALEAGCEILYSADFQHNQLIEGRLRVINPFL